jgi:CDP-glucose 4,6-dehydratase
MDVTRPRCSFIRGPMSVDLFKSAYRGHTVLVTGHSGFKGSWLTAWLDTLGARVTGLSLPPDQRPDNLFERAKIAERCDSRFCDIRDAAAVMRIVSETRPRIVFHLAAQPLVHMSYRDPVGTFATNILGAVHVLEAARLCESVEAVVFVTSDKVYENKEWARAYRENDPLGGLDPYSASKSAAELVARSYMTLLRGGGAGYRLATARGGNVVGGGDWSQDRLVPDIVRALRTKEPLVLRNPGATRPWQHVLELCAGYLTLGARLLDGWRARGKEASAFVGAYNFGPDRASEMSVRQLVASRLAAWGTPDYPLRIHASTMHEATYLRIDSSKAQTELGWVPQLEFEETIDWTMKWYRGYLDGSTIAGARLDAQIFEYTGLYGRKQS